MACTLNLSFLLIVRSLAAYSVIKNVICYIFQMRNFLPNTINWCNITFLLMFYYPYGKCNFTLDQGVNHSQLHCLVCKWPSGCVSNYTIGQCVIIHTKKGCRGWQSYYTIIRCNITVLLVFYYTYKNYNFTLDQSVNHSHYTDWCVNITSSCVLNYTIIRCVIIHRKKRLSRLAKILHFFLE